MDDRRSFAFLCRFKEPKKLPKSRKASHINGPNISTNLMIFLSGTSSQQGRRGVPNFSLFLLSSFTFCPALVVVIDAIQNHLLVTRANLHEFEQLFGANLVDEKLPPSSRRGKMAVTNQRISRTLLLPGKACLLSSSNTSHKPNWCKQWVARFSVHEGARENGRS